MNDVPVVHEHWQPSHRIIPSRFPPIGVYDVVADPADLEAIYWVEALTNDRLRDELGQLHLVDPEDRIVGKGSTPIMAAFTHLNPLGSRFSDGSFGVYYASRTQATAIKEVCYHQSRFLRYSNEKPMDLQMREYLADMTGELHDIRGMKENRPEWYNLDNYGASQQLGQALRENQSWGIIYDSVRDEGGECAGIFRPAVLSPCRQGMNLSFVWNGQEIVDIYERRPM